jgi:hypothetical protein
MDVHCSLSQQIKSMLKFDFKVFNNWILRQFGPDNTADGFHIPLSIPLKFRGYVAAGLPAEQAAFMAQSRVFNFVDNFKPSSPQLRREASRAGCGSDKRQDHQPRP